MHSGTACLLAIASALAAALAPGLRAAEPAKAQTTAAPAENRIVIYRCTDAQGRLSLRDSPCRRGERQDTRTMLRPQDPPPRAPAAARGAAQTASAPAPQVVIVQAARPLYECSGPDESGQLHTYLSESAEGRLRWRPSPGLFLIRPPVSAAPHSGYVHMGEYRPYLSPLVYDNGAWVRDSCVALPQAETCERLREERSRLGRRRFHAQQTERLQISREERSVEARLAEDCR